MSALDGPSMARDRPPNEGMSEGEGEASDYQKWWEWHLVCESFKKPTNVFQ